MSIENARPVIGFDGLHRAGKGTQAELLSDYFLKRRVFSLTVRGDGTREGLGQTPGDPVDTDWQERSRRLKTVDRTVEGWNLASYILARELHGHITNPSGPDRIIVDRTLLSRTAFLLHRGVLPHHQRATLDSLYPDAIDANFPIEETIPDVIFEMSVPDPEILLDRLDPSDPKYDFRAQNIRGGFTAAQAAREYLPESIEARVVTLDATQTPEKIHNQVTRHLGERGLLGANLSA